MNLWGWLLIAHYGLALIAIGSLLRQRKDPVAMLAWVFAVLAVPIFGVWIYWTIGANRQFSRNRRKRRRLKDLTDQVRASAELKWGKAEVASLLQNAPDVLSVARLTSALTDQPPTRDNNVEIFQEANATYTALEDSIRRAKHHIHLLYYIWQPDETGRHFRDLLIARARAGIEVRVLLDAVGSWALRDSFFEPLRAAGGRVAFFAPLLLPRRYLNVQMRNHRKIVVVDGQTALTGSQNIGDEYRGRLKALSPWIDSHLRVTGPAALFLQQTFVEDWIAATHEQLAGDHYFPQPPRAGTSIVQIVPTGPDLNSRPLEQILLAAMATARRTIRIATPYLVPNETLITAFRHATLRGVRVEMVLPTRTDAPLVLWAARSFYSELLDAGVEIYEFDLGVLHSKFVTVDDRWCLFGSANMDIRSFRLNYEISALIYDEQVVGELSASIRGFCGQSRRITPRNTYRRTARQEWIEGAARLFSPLL